MIEAFKEKKKIKNDTQTDLTTARLSARLAVCESVNKRQNGFIKRESARLEVGEVGR